MKSLNGQSVIIKRYDGSFFNDVELFYSEYVSETDSFTVEGKVVVKQETKKFYINTDNGKLAEMAPQMVAIASLCGHSGLLAIDAPSFQGDVEVDNIRFDIDNPAFVIGSPQTWALSIYLKTEECK